MWKKVVVYALCWVLLAGLFDVLYASAAQVEDVTESAAPGIDNGTSGTAGNTSENGDVLEGSTSDIDISGVKVSGGKAGGKVTISFTASGKTNSKKHYTVDTIGKIYPVLNDSFPFEINDAAYMVTNGSANTLKCSYSFTVKDNLETSYYLTGFNVVYSRKSIDGKTTSYDSDYYVTKNVNVKITAKKAAPEATADVAAQDSDVYLSVKNVPNGVYSSGCRIQFNAKSAKYKILSVAPVIDANFPFETNGDAYRVIRSSKGVSNLACNYNMTVKKNVATGYQSVGFQITYLKNGATNVATKTINVQLKGKKGSNTKGGTKKSTPRVMVMGYTTNKKAITPNSKFRLNLQIKNNAGRTVKNVKFTLSTANGEFLPVSGSSTAFVDSIASKGTVNLSFDMKAAASLGARSYAITVKSEYEDNNADPYTAQDNVSIPVTLKDRISLTDVTPPEDLSIGGTSDFSFSINNMGAGALNNVTVSCKGEGFSCEDSYVGNITSGATSYATLSLNGETATGEGDGSCKIIIKYENASGESKTYEEDSTVYVNEEAMDDMGDMEGMDEEAGMEDTGKKSVPLPAIIAGIVAVLVVAIIVVLKLRKKKQIRLEEELMDDELL